MQYAPIALFVYNRPWHLQETVKALQNNLLAKESELFVFSDAAKDKYDVANVDKAREYIKTIKGFKKVSIIERNYNFGLSQSIINGISGIIDQYGKVIVLEDDLVTAPYFLQFLNDALSLYQDAERVISVCAYMYPLSKRHPDTLFLRVADSWGWATWKRGWDLFVADGKQLYDDLKARKLIRKFNLGGSFNYAKMLKAQIQGKNDSWAIRWYATALLNDKLSLYPWKTLVKNIGFDCSGRHGGSVDYYKSELLNEKVLVKQLPIIENKAVIGEIGFFWIKQRFNLKKIIPGFSRKIKRLWLKISSK